MKCQKCKAENINEAVRCGICGTRLKHQKFVDTFTSSTQVQSSIRRDQTKPFSRDKNSSISRSSNKTTQRTGTPRPQKPNDQQSSSLLNTIFDQNTKLEDKAEKLLSHWQQKARQSSDVKKPSKGLGGKIVWILLVIFMFGPVALEIVKKNVMPHIANIFTASVPTEAVEDMTIDQVTTIAGESLEYQVIRRLDELKEVTSAADHYYKTTHQLTTKYQDLVDSDLIVHFINDGQTQFNLTGMLESSFTDDAEVKIFLKPYYDTDSDQSAWMCFSAGIDVSEQTDCKMIPAGTKP